MIMLLRAVFIAAIVLACGVKGAPRPAQPAMPAPVTVPGK
jgi:hypothetical protein